MDEILLEILSDCEVRFKNGDPLALFEAIDLCGRRSLLIPEWAAAAFTCGFNKAAFAEVASWDQAFRPPWPKGTNLKAKRRQMELEIEILLRIEELRAGTASEPPMPVDDGLFERVGAEFGIKKSLCNKLYYQQIRALTAAQKEEFAAIRHARS